MVSHSVDHYYTARAFETEFWISLDGSGSARSYFSSQMFAEIWVPHMRNPFDEELLCECVKNPACHEFYRRIYKDLSEKNVELANVVTMSCSW